ncbi:hypothetical protein [Halorussus halobius]|uniref:hypothetical protein n=1 Tax=Halorussus halobius TaxID=1710537 RepID=UPI001B2FE9A1|nr:hypothetical protein [Halorussus halobius]
MDEGDASDAANGDDSDAEGRRLWLVERTYTDKGLVSLVYATPDGAYAVQRQRSTNMLRRGGGVTAATTVDGGSLDPVEDERTREQYADEAERMADRHDPDDAV